VVGEPVGEVVGDVVVGEPVGAGVGAGVGLGHATFVTVTSVSELNVNDPDAEKLSEVPVHVIMTSSPCPTSDANVDPPWAVV
jgi:hypothetical protein